MRTPDSILRDDQPTDGLEDVVAAFRYPDRRAPRRWSAVAGLAASLALGGVALRLTSLPAQASLMRIAQALSDAPRCSLTLVNGEGKPWLRAWQEGARNAMRVAADEPYGTDSGFDGRRGWIVDRHTKVAVIQSQPARHRLPLVQEIAEYHGKVVRTAQNGDGTHTVVVERAASPTSLRQRDTLVVDRRDRPLSMTHEFERGGRWMLQGRELRDYDSPITKETFAFQPPKGFEVYDVDANRDRLRAGLRTGPARTVAGTIVRLVGALQERGGWVTAVYVGGTTPLPDAVAYAERDGRRYSGHASIGNRLGARFQRSVGVAPSQDSIGLDATPEPYATLDGQPIRIIRFCLPKLRGNTSLPLRVVLPVVVRGARRSLREGAWLVHGYGRSVGTAVFDAVRPIPSNRSEEVYGLSDVPRAAGIVRLRDR